VLNKVQYKRIASVSVSVSVMAETVITVLQHHSNYSFGVVAITAETEKGVSAAVSVTAVRTWAISAPIIVFNFRHVALSTNEGDSNAL